MPQRKCLSRSRILVPFSTCDASVSCICISIFPRVFFASLRLGYFRCRACPLSSSSSLCSFCLPQHRSQQLFTGDTVFLPKRERGRESREVHIWKFFGSDTRPLATRRRGRRRRRWRKRYDIRDALTHEGATGVLSEFLRTKFPCTETARERWDFGTRAILKCAFHSNEVDSRGFPKLQKVIAPVKVLWSSLEKKEMCKNN